MSETVTEYARARDRSPICCTLEFIPLDAAGNWLREQSVEVVGKDLSTAGMAFSHMLRLSSKQGVVCLNHPVAGCLVVEVEVLWSKATAIGLFESGCRMLRKVASPPA